MKRLSYVPKSFASVLIFMVFVYFLHNFFLVCVCAYHTIHNKH